MILIWYFWHGASLLGRCLSPQHSYKVCRDGCALCWAHVTRVEEITRTVGCISRLVPRSPKDGSGPALHVSKLRHASKMHTAEDLYRCIYIYIYIEREFQDSCDQITVLTAVESASAWVRSELLILQSRNIGQTGLWHLRLIRAWHSLCRREP